MSALVEPTYTHERNQDCVHVRCAGYTCLYRLEIPALGPDLPRTIQDSDGKFWRRYEGSVYYRERQGPTMGIATWTEICGGDSLGRRDFPEGPWTVHFAGDWS